MNFTLPLSDTLSLIHAPAIAEGKTATMAKGLFLCEQDQIYAGESAGFGVPVWKTGQHTVFPSLLSVRLLTPNVIEKVYRLNMVATWQIFGINTPRIFPIAMEKIVTFYMHQPMRQQLLLSVRGALCALFQIRSTIIPSRSHGECRVLYTTAAQKLNVTVDGQELQGQGQLILLNEVSGAPFTRLCIGQCVREGRDIPAWQPCNFETMLVNLLAGLGFALIIPPHAESSGWRLACGREIARGLNWAGLLLTTAQRQFSYGVNFQYVRKTHPWPSPLANKGKNRVM